MAAGESQDAHDDSTRRAAAYWNERHLDPEGEAHDNFMSHPMVLAYMTLRAVGAIVDPIDLVVAELRSRTEPGSRVLSVASGRGNNERYLAERLPDRHFVGFDIADRIVAQARDDAARDGVTNVEFDVADFNCLTLDAASYDVILGLGSIHHVEALESFWEQCRRCLRPGGVVLAQEFVGADRFQWSDAQLDHGTRVLDRLVPDEHKTHHRRVTRIPLDAMLAEDPSEAVRSSEILATCAAGGFSIDAVAGAGGSLLGPVLMYQIATFEPRNWRHNRVLAQLFEEEDRLITAGELRDDFAMFVASPR